MKNKKAEITLENTLGIILAIIGISLLFYGAFKLYQVTINQENENARKIINTIEEKINSLKDEEVQSFPLAGIKNWFLVGWSKDNLKRPGKCYFNSCICICPTDTQNPANSCQKSGFCRNIDKNTILILGAPKTIASIPAPYVELKDNLIELEIYKSKDLLKITLKS